VLKLVQWIAVLCLSLTLGLHWAVLQSVAWAGMIVEFSRADGLAVAISKTFDGRHGCQICRIVEKGRETEAADASGLTPLKKFEPAPVPNRLMFHQPPVVAVAMPAAGIPAGPEPFAPTPPPPRLG
jgi:hypothetical protein